MSHIVSDWLCCGDQPHRTQLEREVYVPVSTHKSGAPGEDPSCGYVLYVGASVDHKKHAGQAETLLPFCPL